MARTRGMKICCRKGDTCRCHGNRRSLLRMASQSVQEGLVLVQRRLTLNLAVIWLMSGMNSCRSLASQSFSMCSEAAGTKGSTSSSMQMIMRCRNERTELRSTLRCTGQLSAGRKACRQSRYTSVQPHCFTVCLLLKALLVRLKCHRRGE